MRKFIRGAHKHRRLLENFGYLSALQGFNMVFPLITYPYLIRVLAPEAYGKVVFAQGIAAYYSVVVNFGFQSSAPRDIAEHRDNLKTLSAIISRIFTAKLVLWLVVAMVMLVLVHSVPLLAQDKWLHVIAFGNTATMLLFPIWYFQGIEKMERITMIDFTVKLATVVAIFSLIHTPQDYLKLAALYSGGAVIGGMLAMVVVLRDGVRISIQPWSAIQQAASRSAPLFYSNIFTALADRGGTLVVGAALGPVALAYYNLAEKLTTFAANVYYNISRAVFPNLAKTRDQAFSRKITAVVLLAGVVGSIALGFLAPFLIPVFAGNKLKPAIPLLQILSIYLTIAAMGPLLANVLLLENRHSSLFPNSMLASIFYVGSLLCLWWTDTLTPTNVAITFVATALVRSVHRYYIIHRHGLSGWLHRSPHR